MSSAGTLESTVVAVRARPLDVAMRKAFGIAGGAQTAVRNVLVEVELASGAHGFGEAAPFPAFNGETQETALAACEAAAPTLVGLDARAWFERARPLEGIASASALCALETAILDAYARSLGVSLRQLFGDGEALELVTDVTITTGSVDDARREALSFAAFSTLKIKVGGSDVDLDAARVLAIREARPDAKLLLDANAGLSVADAIALSRAVASASPSLFEQPVAGADLDGLAEVRAKGRIAVAADESVCHLADVDAVASKVDVVNLKIMKSGIVEGIAIAKRTRELGLVNMIGGMVEARLAMGVSACIATALGGFAYVDLDTPLWLAEDPFVGGYVQDGERLDLRPITAGHGAVPR